MDKGCVLMNELSLVSCLWYALTPVFVTSYPTIGCINLGQRRQLSAELSSKTALCRLDDLTLGVLPWTSQPRNLLASSYWRSRSRALSFALFEARFASV